VLPAVVVLVVLKRSCCIPFAYGCSTQDNTDSIDSKEFALLLADLGISDDQQVAHMLVDRNQDGKVRLAVCM